jgi:hypothetical protein
MLFGKIKEDRIGYAYMLWFDYQCSNRYQDNKNPSRIFYPLTDSKINDKTYLKNQVIPLLRNSWELKKELRA